MVREHVRAQIDELGKVRAQLDHLWKLEKVLSDRVVDSLKATKFGGSMGIEYEANLQRGQLVNTSLARLRKVFGSDAARRLGARPVTVVRVKPLTAAAAESAA